MFERGLTCFQLSGLQAVIELFFCFQWEQLLSLCKSILLIGLCHNLRISCNGWFYFPFDMICKSKRAINFHPLISIKANGITSHYNGQPRTVTSSYKFAAPKKDEKANPFLSNYFNLIQTGLFWSICDWGWGGGFSDTPPLYLWNQ